VTDQIVCRRRLHDRLDLGLQTPLTVVAAPAGYGKSVLVSCWAEELERPCAWLSLNTSESDLRVFSDYLLAAVKTCFPKACAQSETVVRSPNPIVIDTLGACLLNDLDEIDEEFVLVLDDYHRIERGSAVHDLLSFLLEHPPANLTLVIATRHDPPFPMASLRANNLVTEIRLDDLRFSNLETSEMLEVTAGIAVTDRAKANLERQFEGWAAGLHLVSLAVRTTNEPDAFLESLHGGLPHTQEYLLQEVLNAQSSEVRDCLLKCSIFDRFCPQVFDAVCTADSTPEAAGINGHEFVGLLQKINLFVIPLDTEGEWFRFHHLFQEILKRQLERHAESGGVSLLHDRASVWFENHGLVDEAILHALAAGDLDRAADIVERYRIEAFDADQWSSVERWLGMLPDELRRLRPGLILCDGWIAYIRLQLDQFSSIIDRCKAAAGDRGLDESHQAELGFFQGSVDYWMGNAKDSCQKIEASLEKAGGRRCFIEGEMELTLALARCLTGDRDGAVRNLEQRIRETEASQSGYLVKLRGALVVVHLLNGDLARALAEAKRFRNVAASSSLQNHVAWAEYFEGCVHLHLLQLDEATLHFNRAADNRYVSDSRAALDAMSGLVLAQRLMGKTDAARDSLSELQEFASGLQDPAALSVVESCAARVSFVGGGDPALHRLWAQGFSEEPSLGSFFVWLEVPLITQARVLIGEGSETSLETAAEFLGALRQQCEAWRFSCQAIEIAALQAVAFEKLGRREEADKTLREAVGLACPGGWVRPFVEAGPVMAEMLERLDLEGAGEIFVRRVLAAFEPADAAAPTELTPPPAAEPVAAARREKPVSSGRPALDALTDRELDILELLQERLYNKEIAAKLHISTHTVNYHLKHIYSKLDVNSRRQAVRRGLEKGVLKTAE
jgi:LuxR family maltose regulon positive regulatory protein